MFSIKNKLIVLVAGVLGVSLTLLATVLVVSEKNRITENITAEAISFAELSGEKIFDNYDLYYRSQSYALFDSELKKLLRKNPSIERVALFDATGNLLFDSSIEDAAELTTTTDFGLLQRLKSNKISLETGDRTVYLSRNLHAAAGYTAETVRGQKAKDLKSSERIDTLLLPFSDEKHRLLFSVSYSEVGSLLRHSMTSLAALFLLGFAGAVLISTRFAGTITAPLSALREGAKKIAKGELDTKIDVESRDETKLLADTFNQMTTDLAAAVDTKIEYERTSRELEVASEIQTSTFPKQVVADGLDLKISFAPATEVGGDSYDVIDFGDKTIFYIADATGHGVPAGMISALTSAVFATAAMQGEEVKIAEIIAQTNTIVHRKTKPNMFVTLIGFVWDKKTKTLSTANAGHEPVLIYRAKTGKVETGEKGSLALGMFPKMPKAPVETEIQLKKGDVMLAFTDGINEAANEEGQQLGMEGLEKFFAEACQAGQTAKEIEKVLSEKSRTFRGAGEQEDDITLLVLKP